DCCWRRKGRSGTRISLRVFVNLSCKSPNASRVGRGTNMRYAIYFTPERDHPLTRKAAQWLGRDAFGGETLPPSSAAPLSAAEVAFQTAAARRYGFHATLKAPFRLAEGTSESEL